MYYLLIFLNKRHTIYEVQPFNTQEMRDDFFNRFYEWYESLGYEVVKAKEEK